MNQLNLYAIFHGNLQFSSIPKKAYKKVIANCYWPLIEILEKYEKLKFGIEFSGQTLLEIEKIDGKLLKKLRKYIEEERIEFIGSGYTQTIFPLIPYEINLRNLKLGIKIYKNTLDYTPSIFYVNEQTFSDGLISVYKDAGINNIIVDFDSTPENVRTNKSLLYKPVRAVSQNGEIINVIWSSSISFQKFQRYIFDEISYEDYWHYLSSNFSQKEKRNFCLYAGDWEVFGFSPKRIDRTFNKDYKRMADLFDSISKDNRIRFVLPSQVASKKITESKISLTNFQEPITSKKQEKYNVSRWALAGKKTIFRNTDCFQLFEAIKNLKKSKIINELVISTLEENLLRLWGSDYRTSTSFDKNREYETLLDRCWKTIKKYSNSRSGVKQHGIPIVDVKNQYKPVSKETFETPNVKLIIDKRKGATIKELIFPKISSSKMLGLIPHGYFQNPRLSADWFTGHCLFEADDGKKYTDLYPVEIFLGQEVSNRFIEVYTEIKTPICDIEKFYRIYNDSPRLDLEYLFNFKSVGLRSARIGNVTLDPHCFDRGGFWYGTVNGGKSPELYKIGRTPIIQDEMISFRISSKGSLAATESWIAVGNKNQGLALLWNKTQIASNPIVHFEQTSQGFYGRIQLSIAESDETGFPIFNGQYSLNLTYFGLTDIKQVDKIRKMVGSR